MGKIKDFFTKIGVTDSDGEEDFQNTTADTRTPKDIGHHAK